MKLQRLRPVLIYKNKSKPVISSRIVSSDSANTVFTIHILAHCQGFLYNYSFRNSYWIVKHQSYFLFCFNKKDTPQNTALFQLQFSHFGENCGQTFESQFLHLLKLLQIMAVSVQRERQLLIYFVSSKNRM